MMTFNDGVVYAIRNIFDENIIKGVEPDYILVERLFSILLKQYVGGGKSRTKLIAWTEIAKESAKWMVSVNDVGYSDITVQLVNSYWKPRRDFTLGLNNIGLVLLTLLNEFVLAYLSGKITVNKFWEMILIISILGFLLEINAISFSPEI